ncbi:TetR/AcrR family transcriptional regulator [Pseudarthrobacter sp. lyk4-40-TYG-27]|uniref:TetR/AcrR family transcriptional regulator n=1 Tax=Pseudarthrobacter sp. lyk4-40-TYG-27 TaxID=3040305 RepID=UPI002554411C|nr:TetR/AcrR family transcriptional regulator [Pseudarthrobacter sp. lyk4-40-TYG-27]
MTANDLVGTVAAREPGVQENGRKEAIVQAARSLFVSEGYSAFSMRSVAKSQGISLGHLQHFFHTKTDLLWAILEYTTETYVRAYESFIRSLPDSPEERFRGVVQYLLDDVRNAEVTAFFVEWWPVTLRDASARELLRRLYKRNMDDFSRFIGDARPDLAPWKVQSLALQVMALIDGILIYCHTESPSDAEFSRVTEEVAATINTLVGIGT